MHEYKIKAELCRNMDTRVHMHACVCIVYVFMQCVEQFDARREEIKLLKQEVCLIYEILC